MPRFSLKFIFFSLALIAALSSTALTASAQSRLGAATPRLAATSATCPQLPAHFDPLQASTSLLSYYHLPPRPSDTTQRANWAYDLSHVKRLVCSNSLVRINRPIILTHVGKIASPSQPFTQSEGGNNWSGYEVNNDTFDDAKGNWNTQCLGGSQNSGAQIATWVGIGGEGTGNLIQTGTLWTKDGHYHLFYEFTPNNAYIDLADNIACTHPITAEVYYSGSIWCTYVQDLSSYLAMEACPYYNWSPNQSTAEWMDDRPICGSLRNGYTFSPLADFNYTSFSNTYAHSPTHGWHTLLGFNRLKVYMQDSKTNRTIAEPDDPPSSSTTFTDRWKMKDTDGTSTCHVP